MPPRSPLPRLGGLDAAWVRTPDRPGHALGNEASPPWPTLGAFLRSRLPPHADVDARLASGGFVDERGRVLTGNEPYRHSLVIWFHRPFDPAEVRPAGEPTLVHHDERLVVVDKPGGWATTPRGAHVRYTVVVWLRDLLALPELTPAHRLDRLTRGVLVLTTQRQWRRPYADLFASRAMTKTYEAIAVHRPDLPETFEIVNRLAKPRGSLRTQVADGEPNAHTSVERLEVRGDWARYRLTPHTGKTHQLRVHLAGLGAPISGDPLYGSASEPPRALGASLDADLQLLARRIAFVDPVDGLPRVFESAQRLAWPDA